MRFSLLFFFVIQSLVAIGLYAQEDALPGSTIGEIEKLDSELDKLLDTNEKIEILASGFTWSEGPVWVRQGGFLLFSDVPKNVIYRWKQGEGLGVYLQPSGFTGSSSDSREPGSNGLAIDANGMLLLCQHGDRRVAKMACSIDSPKPKFETVADKFAGGRFNSPNDLVVHSSGAIYFTDPPYGLAKQQDDPKKELEFQGVYRIAPSGDVSLITKELNKPNGISLSPDESKLYVAHSDPTNAIIMVYDLNSDGSSKESRVFIDLNEQSKTRKGSPDGMAVDCYGNLFATGPGGVLVISPEGKHLGTIMTGERIANCTFGDDGQTLYMTSDMHLCRIRLKTTGLGFKQP